MNYIIYGHTDYLEIINIQTDYFKKYGKTTLFINKNDLDLDDLYSNYDRVIYYDDYNVNNLFSAKYATRLIDCLKQIDDEYFLFSHDIDILINMDEESIDKLYDYMVLNKIDRIDLKQAPNVNSPEAIKFDKSLEFKDWASMAPSNMGDGNYLIKQTNPKDFIYNVNPSIWKRSSLLEILEKFPNKTYRNVEEIDVQNFSTKFNVYKLYTKKPLDCGYFQCLELYTYLHITHMGKLLKLNKERATEFGQSYLDVSDEYVKIIDNYNLRDSIKWRK